MKNYLVKTIGALTVILFLFLIVKSIDDHDSEVCYENIEKVKIGDTYEQAMEKMKCNIIFFNYNSEECFDHHSVSCNTITFCYRDDNDEMSSFPSFCYSKKTHKVLSIKTGLFF